AEALAASPYLTRLATLQLWMCALPPSRAVCLTFANSPHLTGLREVRLHQLYGGLLAEREAHATNIFADAQASKLKQAGGESFQAVVERPFQRLFPLDGDLGYGMFAGRLPDGRQALAAITVYKELTLATFDAQGALIGTEVRDLKDILTRKPEHTFQG